MIPPLIARTLGHMLMTKEMKERMANLHFYDAGHGYDNFGMHPDYISFGVGFSSPIYEKYFRVISHNNDRIPSEGAVIVAANHSGNIPFDGMMLWHDLVRHTDPPRVARAIADHFVPALPFIGTLFARGGVVGGSRGNARALLERGEMLMIFPEGTPGIIKPWSKRYQLQKFRAGHAELAIRHACPILPVGIVGAEEQLPSLFSSRRLGRLMGLEAVPIPIVPLPLPVRYQIFYGEPIPVHKEFTPAEADDPQIVLGVAKRVQDAVDQLLQDGLKKRVGVFR